MTPFSRIEGVAAPIARANIDTDRILPARFLKTVRREGLGEGLFADMRTDPGFVLNRAPWDRAQVLVALENFGCGSSREHAPWALLDFGIRCIIAPGFADIFYNNCFKNGMLPVVLPRDVVTELLDLAGKAATATVAVDLPRQEVRAGGRVWRFDIDPKRKANLIEGLDEIGASLAFTPAIEAFEAERAASQPWLPSIVMP